MRPSHLYNGNFYSGKMTSLYWDEPLLMFLTCHLFLEDNFLISLSFPHVAMAICTLHNLVSYFDLYETVCIPKSCWSGPKGYINIKTVLPAQVFPLSKYKMFSWLSDLDNGNPYTRIDGLDNLMGPNSLYFFLIHCNSFLFRFLLLK